MNTSFTVIDRNNNLQKRADTIVKFKFEEKDYIVYSIDENEQNKQIFVSRLIINSEGKYFIENIMPEEKGKLNNIVYNIVILLPTDFKKGGNPQMLIEEFTKKHLATLSNEIPELNIQEYYSSCSVAITSGELVVSAIDFFRNNLVKESNKVEIPTWSVPDSPVNNVTPTPEVIVPTNNVVPAAPAVEPVPTPNIAPTNVQDVTPNLEVNQAPINMPINQEVMENNLPNPQIEKLAIVSDPNLANATGLNPVNVQPNLGKQKKAGYANTKYVVIGTICLVLAIAVVVAAYFLIKNMNA